MAKATFIGKSHGYSMSPIINPGDKLYVRRVDKKDLSYGDIIVFFSENKLISHRIFIKKKNKVIPKGDNSISPDLPIDYGRILGKVVRIKGKYGNINLESNKAKIASLYFLLRSLMMFYTPFFLYRLLLKIMRGRKIMTKFISS